MTHPAHDAMMQVHQAQENRLAEFRNQHPELVAKEPSDQLELFPESEAGHRQQPYEMSPEEFVHNPGAWFHGNSLPWDVNRRRNGPQYANQHQGTHLGTLKAAAEITRELNDNYGRESIHVARVPEGVLPVLSPRQLARSYRAPSPGQDDFVSDAQDAVGWHQTLATRNNAQHDGAWTMGVLYQNQHEDEGSISATVPHHTTLTPLDWVQQGMREHPERVHPGLKAWAENTDASMLANPNAIREEVDGLDGNEVPNQWQMRLDNHGPSGQLQLPDQDSVRNITPLRGIGHPLLRSVARAVRDRQP